MATPLENCLSALKRYSILVHTGVIVDASITDSPRKPKGKKEYEIVEDRKEDDVKERRKERLFPSLF